MNKIRLQKFLSQAGVCSRRKGEEHIRNGHVRLNGQVVTELGTKVDPEHDVILFRDTEVTLSQENIYVALNKPAGIITSCKHGNEKVVTDLINLGTRIYPVGRLDKDSQGLLLLVNDGKLHHALSHPSFDHEKEYVVRVKHRISDGNLQKLAAGIVLSGRMTRKARVKRMTSRSFSIVLKEGRNRQIRRMVGKTGNVVLTLTRIRMANIVLDDLKEGTWRYLTDKEIRELKRLVG